MQEEIQEITVKVHSSAQCDQIVRKTFDAQNLVPLYYLLCVEGNKSRCWETIDCVALDEIFVEHLQH